MKLRNLNLGAGISYLVILLILGLSLTPIIGLIGSVNKIDIHTLYTLLEHSSLLLDSFLLSGLATIIAGGLGGVFAFTVVHIQKKWAKLYLMLLVSPLFIPSYMHALSWSRLLQEGGFIHSIFGITTIDVLGSWFLTSWVLAISYFPIIFLVTAFYCQRWNRDYHNAVILHAHEKSALALEIQYLKQPFIVSCIVVFFFSFADFGVADLFQVRVYSTEIFIQLSAFYNITQAINISLPVILIGVVLLWGTTYQLRRLPPAKLNHDPKETVRYISKSFSFFKLFLYLALFLILLPIFNLIYLAGSVKNIITAVVLTAGDVFSSALIASLASVITVSIALTLSYAHVRLQVKITYFIRMLLYFVLLMPASVLALGLIQFWNQEGWMGWVYQSGGVLLIGLVLRWLAVAFELFHYGWRLIGVEQEHSVYLSGGRRWSAIWNIVLPQQRVLIAFVFALSFIFAYNEISMLVLISPPGFNSMTLRIFSAVHYGADHLLAAMSVVQLSLLYTFIMILILLSESLSKKLNGRWYNVKG